MNDNHLQIDTSLVWKINKKICIGIINNICCQCTWILVTAWELCVLVRTPQLIPCCHNQPAQCSCSAGVSFFDWFGLLGFFSTNCIVFLENTSKGQDVLRQLCFISIKPLRLPLPNHSFLFFFTSVLQSRVVKAKKFTSEMCPSWGCTAGCIWHCGCLHSLSGPSSEMQSQLSKCIILFNQHHHHFKGKVTFKDPWDKMGRTHHITKDQKSLVIREKKTKKA